MESYPSPSSTAALTSVTSTAAAVCTTSGGGGDDGLCEPGKLFVGGIRWGATEAALRDYFGKYGEVAEAVIVKDKGTGKARGFGFVSFVDPSSADRVVEDASVKHSILGRPVEVKRAIPRRGQQQNQLCRDESKHRNGGLSKSSSSGIDGGQNRTRKIFVGGLSAETTEGQFMNHFKKFGTISDVVIMYNRMTNRPRGFGFITFDSEESVDKAVRDTFRKLNGKNVEVKRAVPSEGNNISNSHHKNGDNRNGYSPRINNGSSIIFGNYPGGIYFPYSAGFGHLQAYDTPCYPPIFYWYGEGYCSGGYGFDYGAPFASPSTWNGYGFMGARQSPLPFGTTGFYPGYFNANDEINPYVDIGAGGSSGVKTQREGKWNQNDNRSPLQAVSSTTPLQFLDKKLNDQRSSDH